MEDTLKGLVPSALIRIAVKDLRAVERSKKYIVEMGSWHEYGGSDLCDVDKHCEQCDAVRAAGVACAVCFAGSVMARTMGCDPTIDYFPENFPKQTKRRLCALDFFREGNIADGLSTMGLKLPWGIPEEIEVSSYEDPIQFKKDMLSLANLLEKLGM